MAQLKKVEEEMKQGVHVLLLVVLGPLTFPPLLIGKDDLDSYLLRFERYASVAK